MVKSQLCWCLLLYLVFTVPLVLSIMAIAVTTCPLFEAGSLPLCSDGLGTSCTFHFDFNYENVLGERKNDAQVYVFESASHRHDLPPVGSGSLPSYSEGPGQLFILYF